MMGTHGHQIYVPLAITSAQSSLPAGGTERKVQATIGAATAVAAANIEADINALTSKAGFSFPFIPPGLTFSRKLQQAKTAEEIETMISNLLKNTVDNKSLVVPAKFAAFACKQGTNNFNIHLIRQYQVSTRQTPLLRWIMMLQTLQQLQVP